MFVEVVHVFDHAAVLASGDGGVIEEGEVLDQLAEANAAGVRADRDAELGSEQQVGDVLVDAAHPGGIKLQDVDGAGLKQLLEHNAAGHGLAGGDADRSDAPPDVRMSQDVIGAGGLFDPVGIELGQLVDPFNRLGHLPALVGIDGDGQVAHGLPGLEGLTVASIVSLGLLVPFAVATFDLAAIDWAVVGLLLGVGVLSSALPYSLDTWILRRITPRIYAIVTSFGPVIAAVFGWLVLSESFSLTEVIAILIVCGAAGTALATQRSRPKSQLEQTAEGMA